MVLYLIITLIISNFIILVNTLESSTTCDCGFKDENGNIWSNIWHSDYQQSLNNNNKQIVHPLGLQHDKNYMVMDYTVRRNLSGLPHDYLRVFSPDNIRLTPYSVQLTVEIDHDILTSAAFGTQRNDILYGTFRASMKPPVAPGTVSSFYYFESNSAEIDVEILGRYTDPRQAFFVVHPQIYNQDGSASNLTHQRKNLQSDPTLDFHEYRFDWLPGLVDYFVDGNLSATINTNVPSVPGRIIVNHWSDGNPNFSGLPEEGQNIVLDVANLTFFFNSSNDIFGPPCESSKTPCDVKDIMSRKLLPGSSATSLTSSSLRSLLSLLIIPIVLVSFIMSS